MLMDLLLPFLLSDKYEYGCHRCVLVGPKTQHLGRIPTPMAGNPLPAKPSTRLLFWDRGSPGRHSSNAEFAKKKTNNCTPFPRFPATNFAKAPGAQLRARHGSSTNRCGSKLNGLGLCRCWSMFPLTRATHFGTGFLSHC